MAKKKATVKPKPPQAKLPAQRVRPGDYIRGSQRVGEKYTAWDTYGQGRPDMGKTVGPGEPYHEVQRTVQKPLPGTPNSPAPGWVPRPGNAIGGIKGAGVDKGFERDPRISIIRKRLGWL